LKNVESSGLVSTLLSQQNFLRDSDVAFSFSFSFFLDITCVNKCPRGIEKKRKKKKKKPHHCHVGDSADSMGSRANP